MSTQPTERSVGPNPKSRADPMSQRCSATSKAKGVQCGRSAIPGGTVCGYHGGRAPQVKRKAEERLRALVDPALGALGELVRQKKVPPVRLAAARDILDRNKVGASSEPPPAPQVNIALMLSNLSDEELRVLRGITARLKADPEQVEVEVVPAISRPPA